LVLLLAVGATVALAYDNYDFEGDGECGDLSLWQSWQGTVYAQSPIPYFLGYWGNLAD